MTERKTRKERRPLSRVFAMPAAIGAVSAIGLVVALVDDGLWDVLGWISLGVAPAVTVWCLSRRTQ